LKINKFFKPTSLYKEYMILDIIEKNRHITQREIGNKLGVAVSMVNKYIEEYESNQLIKRTYHSPKIIEYIITLKGIERKKLLNIWYLKSSQEIYLQAKDNIISFLYQIIEKGFKKILFYGGGDVSEIMLYVLNSDHSIPLKVLAVIDDDQNKIGGSIVNIPIIGLNSLDQFDHDAIFIASYKHREMMSKNLLNLNYPKGKIIRFFSN